VADPPPVHSGPMVPGTTATALWAVLLGAGPGTTPEPFALQWDAQPGCPDAATVRAHVEDLLERPLSAPTGDGMHVRTHAIRAEGGWSIDVIVRTGGIERARRLPASATCEEAARAAALVIAIAIDPNLGPSGVADSPPEDSAADLEGPTEAAVPEPQPVPERDPLPPAELVADDPEPPVTEVVGAQDPTTTSRLDRPPVRGLVGLGPLVGWNDWPNVGAGLTVFVGITRGRLRALIDASYWGARTVEVDRAAVVFRAWTLGALAGPVFALPRNFEVGPLLGVEGGQTIVRSRGLGVAEDPADPWVAARIRVHVGWTPLRWLSIGIGAEPFVPLRRSRYTVAGAGTVHQAGVVGIRGLLAIEARFP
jgi:hypothetical protein